MSSINGEEGASSPDAQTVALDTKLMVATDCGDGGGHGDGYRDSNKESAVAMAVATATSKKPSKEDKSHGGSINPLLLVSAHRGSWEALNVLLEREDAKIPPMMIITPEFLELVARERNSEGKSVASAARDVEEGVDHQPDPLAAGALLNGLTPVGDTALHVVARNGDRKNFLKYASIIYDRDSDLLFAKNHRGDTSLHCAARAGNFEMASHLIDLAGREGADRKLKLLRMENKLNETALHEAVRTEDGRILGPNDREALFDPNSAPEERIRAFVNQQEERTIVKLLMGADSELANYPAEGISPLYLAILLEKSTIAVILCVKSGGNLSYSGACGQNALHVAVLRNSDTVIIEFLLDCNKSLTTQVDKDGSTPLHFVWFSPRSAGTLEKIFKANPAALYQADKNGFFPIHVAALAGAKDAITFFLRECPDSAGLLDAEGKTFLHVATEKRRLAVVLNACQNPSLAWILNMQDSDGNTALHLAIQAGRLRIFCALFGNRKVNLNLANNSGETPRDISRSKLPRGMGYGGNSENRINYALRSVSANHGALRQDKNEEKYSRRPKTEHEDKESERLKDATQTFIVASVLIATMAFSATFAIPGGYKADDHTNGGTPTLAGRYISDAFIMATTLAFICSILATVGFMFAGIPIVNLKTRKMYLVKSVPLMASSVTCLCIAFALAVYMVLAPVARNTAIAVCVITFPVSLYLYIESFHIMVILARPLLIRKGLIHGMVHLLRWSVNIIASALWPFIITFGWAALARIHHRR